MKNKVILISSLFFPNIGGVENSIKEMAEVLKNKGIEFVVICSDRNYTNNNVLKTKECFSGGCIYRYSYPKTKVGFFMQYIYCARLVRKIYKDGDIVISRSYITSISARLAGVKKVAYIVPSVIFFQDMKWDNIKGLKKFTRYMVNSFFQTVAFFVSEIFVFSEIMSRQVKAASFMLKGASIVSPGVSRERFSAVSLEKKKEIKNGFGIDLDKKIILCIGRFSEVKQFELAIEAASFLPDTYQVLLVGKGKCEENYQKKIDRLRVENKVRIMGPTKTPQLFYQIADVFWMTSRYEAFGQVLLEATSCGVPIVAFSNKAGVNTSVEKIYGNFPTLASYCDSMLPSDLAECTQKAVASELNHIERQEFLKSYSWSALVERVTRGKV